MRVSPLGLSGVARERLFAGGCFLNSKQLRLECEEQRPLQALRSPSGQADVR